MKEYQSLSHTRWDCKYHLVFIPKRRKKRIFGVLRQHLGEMFHEMAYHKEAWILEGHQVYICISISPKYAVSNVVGYLTKGERHDPDCTDVRARHKNFTGEHFWARGYFVSTVGLDEHMVPAYIRNQDEEYERYDQMKLEIR
jgi:putative transposase